VGAILEAALLGLLQGLTEFLPISSSGHIAIGMKLLGWKDPDANLAFAVALHLGSLAAVVLFTWREIRAMLTTTPRLLLVTIVATVPLAVIGLLVKDLVAALAENMFAVGGCLLFTAAVLAFVRRRDEGTTSAPALSLWRALGVGLAQAVAILPGVSRSGSTLAGGLLAGLERTQAVRFAFLLAAPAIGGAGLLMALDGGLARNGTSHAALATGTFVSFLASLFAMKVMVRVVEQRRLGWFALYCACIGIFALALG